MTSSTGRPSSPPLALTSSRQISSAVLITLLGAAPAPVSARLNPTLMGLPLCADAPDSASKPTMNAATNARSAFPHNLAIVSSLNGASLRAALAVGRLFMHFLCRHNTPVIRSVRVLGPDLRLLRPVAMPRPRLEMAELFVHLVELREQFGDQPVRRAVIGEQVVADAVAAGAPQQLVAVQAEVVAGGQHVAPVAQLERGVEVPVLRVA